MNERAKQMNEETEIEVLRLLDKAGIGYDIIHHEEAFSMEICERIEKTLGAPVCKNLFLCNRQQTDFYLLMIPGKKIFKTKYLSSQLSCARLSFAGEEAMQSLLHIKPGSVSPMGLMYDTENKVRLVIDRDLMSDEEFGCHPCVNTATLKIQMKDFIEKFLPAVHHDCTIVDLPDVEKESHGSESEMKVISVVAAVILKDGQVFSTQRGYGDWAGWWEFPGGKIEPGEKPEDALVREIKEELATEIAVDRFICTVEHDYPTFHLTMHNYMCHVMDGDLKLLEHKDARWLDLDQMDDVKWLPADKKIIGTLREILSSRSKDSQD